MRTPLATRFSWMHISRTLVAAVVAAALPARSLPAINLDPPADECAVALNKDLIQVISTQTQQYAYLSIIDKTTFDELKRNAALTVSIPIVGGLIGGSADYNEFVVKRDALFARTHYVANQTSIDEALHVVTNPIAYTFWAQCEQARSTAGFFAWKDHEDQSTVVIHYRWISPPGVNKSLRLTGTVEGATVVGAGALPPNAMFAKNKTVGVNGNGAVTLRRLPGRPTIVATIAAGEYPPATVHSEWRSTRRPVSGQAIAVTTFAALDPIELGTVSASANSENENNERCNHAPCSPDGKWQASPAPMTISMPGRKLKNAEAHCVGHPDAIWNAMLQLSQAPGPVGAIYKNEVSKGRGSACPWSWVSAVTYTPDLSTVSATGYGYTVPLKFELTATEYIEQAAQHESRVAMDISSGNYFSFLAPDGAVTVLHILVEGSDIVVQPGQSTPDGAIRFVNSVPGANGTWYNYDVPNVAFNALRNRLRAARVGP